jgi:hypothetical protein
LWTLVGRCDVEVPQVIETPGIVWQVVMFVV